MSESIYRQAALALNFQETVEKAVQPVLESAGRPIYHLPHLKAQQSVEIAGNKIDYMLFGERATEGGVQQLDFVPSHALQVVMRNNFFETTTSQTMFGLRDDDQIIRSHFSRKASLKPRELDPEEASAIVDFMMAPHLNVGRLAVAMRFTPEEQTRWVEWVARSKKFSEQLREELEEIEEAERRAWAEVSPVDIGPIAD
jgi:hypothetical protein